MMGNAIKHVADELNMYISLRLGNTPDVRKVYLSTIVDPEGKVTIEEENVVLLTLIDVRQDSVTPPYGRVNQRQPNGLEYQVNASLFAVNLYLLFSCYFPSDPQTALNYLSFVLNFFTVKPSFDPQNTPGLTPGIDRLTFEMETQDFQEKSHMWGLVGSNYIPSALYKMRMISFTDTEPDQFTPPISKPDIDIY